MPETNFFWDPLSDNILQERDETGAVTAEYTTEPGLYGNLISQNRSGVESQYHVDALGSTLALTDDNQQVTDTYAYSAFGEVTDHTGSTVNPFQYVGQKGICRDELSGVYCVRRRALSSDLGRWLSPDPLSLLDEINWYVFVANSPFSFHDPSGEIKVTTLWKSRQLKCNESVPEVNFKFELEFRNDKGEPGAPCRGYIIQKVTVKCVRRVPCPCEECTVSDEDIESYEYWEAWAVAKGDKSVIDRAGGIPTWGDSCGKYSQEGEIRFYCRTRTEVPKTAKDRFGTGSLEGKWKKKVFGDTKLCSTTTITLPGTDNPKLVPFWDGEAKKDPIDGPASRSIELTWNCCGDKPPAPMLKVQPAES